MNPVSLETRIEELLAYLQGSGSALLAYSGGTDSTLLLYLLKRSGIPSITAVTSVSDITHQDDIQFARDIVSLWKVKHIEYKSSFFDNPEAVRNTRERCYFCKHVFFSKLIGIASENNIEKVIDGTHSGDTLDYRPGSRAVSELGICSPFKDTGWDKDIICEVSRHLEIPGSGRMSESCLATRVPYGVRIGPKNLMMIKDAEEFLKGLGFKGLRVRSDGVTARIEIDQRNIKDIAEDEMRKKIAGNLRAMGFKFISLDMEGFESGKMNRLLNDTGKD
ncbi:MAG: ATP-dependent sacrificial sulfur transferase LarE [Elusimicrobiota bacterium]